MPFAASLSQHSETDQALDATCSSISRELGAQSPDLAIVFTSHHHRRAFPRIASGVQNRLHPKVLLGCAGEFIAGGNQEIEDQPALSLWSGVMPNARLVPFQLTFESTPDGLVTAGWPDELSGQADVRAVILIGEPQTTAVDAVIERLADELPGVPLVGGMASGGRSLGENCLFLNGNALDHGAVGVAIIGGPRVTAIVSQGCRPIGPNFVVTKAKDNIVLELGGEPPLARLQQFFPSLPQRDQELLQRGPHLGIAINEYQDHFETGDFLISNVIGADHSSGAIAIGNFVRVGQTVRFHVRDAETADEELHILLRRYRETAVSRSAAALLFSCNGRGTRLFSAPHHDAATIQEELGTIPVAGFFANGELGPVGNKNYIHGYTASVVCFTE